MKYLLMLNLVFAFSYSLLAVDQLSKDELFDSDGAPNFGNLVLYDLKNDWKDSPLSELCKRLQTWEHYEFLRCYYNYYYFEETEVIFNRIKEMCLEEKDGGKQEINCPHAVYGGLPNAFNTTVGLREALDKITSAVSKLLIMNLKNPEYAELKKQYEEHLSKAAQKEKGQKSSKVKPDKEKCCIS